MGFTPSLQQVILVCQVLLVILATHLTGGDAHYHHHRHHQQDEQCETSHQVRQQLKELVRCEARKGKMIFPTEERTGNVDSHLFDMQLTNPWSGGSSWHTSYEPVSGTYGGYNQHQATTWRHKHFRRQRYGRRKRSTSSCIASRVCTPVFTPDEDPDRVPRDMPSATCPNCSRCSELGGSCTPVMFTITVFKNCTTAADSTYASCTSVQQPWPVGCTCIMDTLSDKR